VALVLNPNEITHCCPSPITTWLYKPFLVNVMKKMAVVHRGKVIIIIKYYRLSHNVVT